MASSPPLPPSLPTLGTREGLVAMAVARPRPPSRPFSSLYSPSSSACRPFTTTTSSSSTAAPLTASVGSPPPAAQLQWSLDGRHLIVLNVVACGVAISASWLFFSAIPALLAFKRAAKSLEKLLDVTMEELPDTMAAVRLSGMEISDLTMELSELGQEIRQGVSSSTRAVRLAEDRLHNLTMMASTVPVQVTRYQGNKGGPVIANAARNMREGIVSWRAILGAVFTLTQLSRWAVNFFAAHRKKHLP